MVLQIEGYDTVVPNEVYTYDGLDRSEFPQLNRLDQRLGTMPINPIAILVVDRYKHPADKNQVIEYLKERSREAVTMPQLTDAEGNPISSGNDTDVLVSRLSRLPLSVLVDLRADHPNLLETLKKLMPLNDGGSEYVRLGYGILPDAFLEENSHVTADGRKGYLALLNFKGMRNAGFGFEWGMKLRLHDSYFIPKEHMDLMLRYANNSFDVDGAASISGRFDRDDVAFIINELYEGLPTADDVRQLRDASEEVLEGLAVQTVDLFFKNVVMPQVVMAKAAQERIRRGQMPAAGGRIDIGGPAGESLLAGDQILLNMDPTKKR